MDYLASDLLVAHVISVRDKEAIDACKTRYDKADKFLDLLPTKPDEAFDSFLEVLKQRKDDNKLFEWIVNQFKDDKMCDTVSSQTALTALTGYLIL